jgi:hypothetical protein
MLFTSSNENRISVGLDNQDTGAGTILWTTGRPEKGGLLLRWASTSHPLTSIDIIAIPELEVKFRHVPVEFSIQLRQYAKSGGVAPDFAHR